MEQKQAGVVRYDYLPTHMQDGARLYVERGAEPGGFLSAVLENRLVDAFGRADAINQEAMKDWATWLYNDCPYDAWGSPAIVSAWIGSGGTGGA